MQDAGGEDDDIAGRGVVGVHGRRGHGPFPSVDGFVQAGDEAVPVPLPGPRDVSEEIPRCHPEPGIVPPDLGVTDHDAELRHLFQGAGAGLRAHPGDPLDPPAHGGLDVGHQAFHQGFGLRREIGGHVVPPQGLAELVVNQGDRPLPARLLLLLPGQHLAPEVEVRIVECRRDVRGRLVGEAESHVGFKGRQRGFREDLGDFRKGLLLAQDQARHAGEARALQVVGPWKAGREAGQFPRRRGIVGAIPIPALGVSPGSLRDLRLEREDSVRRGARIRPAGKRQKPLHIGPVFGALTLEAGLEIVIPVRQVEARLAQIHGVGLRISGVIEDGGRKDRASESLGRAAHEPGDLPMGARPADLFQAGFDRLGAQFGDPGLVHVVPIEDRQPRPVLRGRGIRHGPLQDGAHALRGKLPQHVEGPEAGPVGGNLQPVQIDAVGMAEEVFRGRGGWIPARQVKAPGPHSRRGEIRGGGGQSHRKGESCEERAGEGHRQLRAMTRTELRLAPEPGVITQILTRLDPKRQSAGGRRPAAATAPGSRS